MKKAQGMAGIAASIFAAASQAEQPIGWYISPQLGIAHITIDDPDLGGTWNVVAYNIAGAYQLTRSVAVEVGYMGTAKLRQRIESTNTIDVTDKYRGFTASVVGSAPLSERWSFFGRGGGVYIKENAKGYVNGDLVVSASDTSTKLYLGAGFAANVDGGQVTFEYDRAIGLDTGTFSTFMLGVRWFVGAQR